MWKRWGTLTSGGVATFASSNTSCHLSFYVLFHFIHPEPDEVDFTVKDTERSHDSLKVTQHEAEPRFEITSFSEVRGFPPQQQVA